MVASVDGFVATKDNSISWLDTSDYYEKGIELTEEATRGFLETIDCYVMGSRTYEHALELSTSYGWPYGNVTTIVLSHRELPVNRPNIETYSGDLVTLVNDRLKSKYRNVWVVGGSMVTKEFIRLNLADEVWMTVMPIILGEGKPFFNQVGQEVSLHLKNVRAYKSGMIEIQYEMKR